MTFNFTGLAVAVSFWLATVVLAWPAHHPGVALITLAGYCGLLLLSNALPKVHR